MRDLRAGLTIEPTLVTKYSGISEYYSRCEGCILIPDPAWTRKSIVDDIVVKGLLILTGLLIEYCSFSTHSTLLMLERMVFDLFQ